MTGGYHNTESATGVIAAALSIAPPPTTPLGYMLGVMNDATADFARRDRMAIAAAPFVHKRVADAPEGKKDIAEAKAEPCASQPQGGVATAPHFDRRPVCLAT